MLHFTLFILSAISTYKSRHAPPSYGSYNGQAHTSIVYQQQGVQYASLPPPPPGMAYLVPMNSMASSYPTSLQTVPLPKSGGQVSNLPEAHTSS